MISYKIQKYPGCENQKEHLAECYNYHRKFKQVNISGWSPAFYQMSAHQLMETKLHVIPHTSSGWKVGKLLDLSRSRTHFLYSIPSLFSSFSNYFQPIPPSLLGRSEPSDLNFLTFTSTISVPKGTSSFSHDHSVWLPPTSLLHVAFKLSLLSKEAADFPIWWNPFFCFHMIAGFCLFLYVAHYWILRTWHFLVPSKHFRNICEWKEW